MTAILSAISGAAFGNRLRFATRARIRGRAILDDVGAHYLAAFRIALVFNSAARLGLLVAHDQFLAPGGNDRFELLGPPRARQRAAGG
jgi:hypothetical protein